MPSHESNRLHNLINNIDRLANQLADLERRGLGNTPEAHSTRRELRDQLRELSEFMKRVNFFIILNNLKIKKIFFRC